MNGLSYNTPKKSSGFNSAFTFKIFWITIHIWAQYFLVFLDIHQRRKNVLFDYISNKYLKTCFWSFIQYWTSRIYHYLFDFPQRHKILIFLGLGLRWLFTSLVFCLFIMVGSYFVSSAFCVICELSRVIWSPNLNKWTSFN